VLQITKRPAEALKQSMESYGESIGFLKLSAEAAKTLAGLLDQKVNAGSTSIEHEQVYPDLFEKHPVGCEQVAGIPWTEIDTPEDLVRAQKEILPLWTASPCLNRQLAAWFLPVIVPLPVTPNQWTVVGLMLGLASLCFFARGDIRGDWIGALLFQAFYIVDNWDGEVARRKNLSSRFGGWLDFISDGIIQIGLPLSFAWGLSRSGLPGWVWVAGIAAAVGVFFDFIATGWAKVRGFGPAIFGDSLRRGSHSGLGYWIRVNMTNENFSWVVVVAMALSAKWVLLLAMSIGCQAYWIQFVSSEWRRLRLQ
jgi:phosphatidylglycerophosphate synthase